MGCPRGKASPNAHTKRRLFAASAGYCQNPNCLTELFVDTDKNSFHIAEMAHIFAAQDDGPRPKPKLSKEERGAFENLIMLCSNCHTMVDKAPDTFPDQLILQWKREHQIKLQGLFGAKAFDTRNKARELLDPILTENHAIFQQYGPHIEAANNPESGAAEQWKRKMLSRILPNSRRMLAILDANRNLLDTNEKLALEQFRQHIDDLEAFHIEGVKIDSSRFPSDFVNILKD